MPNVWFRGYHNLSLRKGREALPHVRAKPRLVLGGRRDDAP